MMQNLPQDKWNVHFIAQAMFGVVKKKILICIHTLLTLERQSSESSTEKKLLSVGNVIVLVLYFVWKERSLIVDWGVHKWHNDRIPDRHNFGQFRQVVILWEASRSKMPKSCFCFSCHCFVLPNEWSLCSWFKLWCKSSRLNSTSSGRDCWFVKLL